MAGINSNTKLMLHFNGIDGSTTMTDDSPSSHTVTAYGSAQLDTAYKKFGTASLYLDGDSDYLLSADSSDWDFVSSTSDKRTIDFCIRLDSSTTGQQSVIVQRVDSDNYWFFVFYTYSGGSNSYFWFQSKSGGSQLIRIYEDAGKDVNDGNWHHVAIIKVEDDIGLYLDGNQVGYGQLTGTGNFNEFLRIGTIIPPNTANYTGWIDELRIQNENYFSASPVSGNTDTITVPTEEYSEPNLNKSSLILLFN